MGFVKTLVRAAGIGLCAVAFTGSALADPGNGSGNGGTPPGQEKKAEQASSAPAPTPQAASAPGQAKKADKAAVATESQQAKSAAKAEQKADASKGRSAEAHHHVVICHRTGSESNPYVVINIPWTAWSEAHSPDTGAHPDLDGRHDIMLKDPASRPGSKDGFSKADCEAAAPAPVQPLQPAQQAPAEPTDVCPNVAGMQAEVPAGMVKDASGACVHKPQPKKQTDVCPNIAGMQATVPAGMVRDATGNCLAPVTLAVSDTASGGKRGKKPAATGEALAAVKKPNNAATERPTSGVLGEVASAPASIARTATTGSLPFTGIPLWIAALLGAGLLATGVALRRAAAQH